MNETQPSKSADVTDALSNALLRATTATAVVIAMDMEDGTVWFFNRGSLTQKIGLAELLRERVAQDSEELPTREEEEGDA